MLEPIRLNGKRGNICEPFAPLAANGPDSKVKKCQRTEQKAITTNANLPGFR